MHCLLWITVLECIITTYHEFVVSAQVAFSCISAITAAMQHSLEDCRFLVPGSLGPWSSSPMFIVSPFRDSYIMVYTTECSNCVMLEYSYAVQLCYTAVKRVFQFLTWLFTIRAAERAEGTRGKAFMHMKNANFFNYLCRHGQLINGVATCLHASKCLSTLTAKADYSTPKRSLIESRQCRVSER